MMYETMMSDQGSERNQINVSEEREIGRNDSTHEGFPLKTIHNEKTTITIKQQ